MLISLPPNPEQLDRLIQHYTDHALEEIQKEYVDCSDFEVVTLRVQRNIKEVVILRDLNVLTPK